MLINLYKTFVTNKENMKSINSFESNNIYYSIEKSLLAINVKNIFLQKQLTELKELWKTKPIEIYQKTLYY